MSEKVKAQISAYLDGELADRECELLLRRIAGESDFRDVVERYSLIGEAVRETSVVWTPELAPGILAAVEKEAPLGESGPAPSGWRRTLAGIGVAATVAVLAVLAIRPDAAPDSDATVVAETPEDVGIESYVVPPIPERRPTAVPARLTSYMMSHSEYSGSLGPSGALTGIVTQLPEEEPVADEEQTAGDERDSNE